MENILLFKKGPSLYYGLSATLKKHTPVSVCEPDVFITKTYPILHIIWS